jgi:hypothetical protein
MVDAAGESVAVRDMVADAVDVAEASVEADGVTENETDAESVVDCVDGDTEGQRLVLVEA